jgi:hypothetical protein
MILDLQCTPQELLEIRINGQVAAEICVGNLELIDPEMLKAARANNALRYIVKSTIEHFEKIAGGKVIDHSVTAKDRLDTLLRGFQDGLAGKMVPYGSPCVPDTRPDFGLTYDAGYSAGVAVKRAYTQASLLDEQENCHA